MRISVALAVCLFAITAPTAAEDWAMWGGSPARNNVPNGKNIPASWDVGKYDRKTGKWFEGTSKNIKWRAQLGSQTYGNPVVADGRVFVGTNNSAAYLKRAPANVDLGCLLAFRETDGKFLWQYSAEKLPTGRVNDWPMQGICSAPLVEGKRMWFVDNRGQVVCLDTAGFHDGTDNGPVKHDRVRLFRVLPGLPQNKLRSLSWGGNSTRAAVYTLFEVHGLSTSRCARVVNTVPDKQWTLSPRRGGPLYQMEIDEFAIHVLKLDASAKPTGQAALVIYRDEVRGLDRGHLTSRARDWFTGSGIDLPEKVDVKVVTKSKEWTVTADVEGKPTTFWLEQQGLWLIGHKQLTVEDTDEADVVWRLDMMKELGTSQHNMATCSPLTFGDVMFVTTCNGVDETHFNIPKPDAPSFIAVDKHTGELLWTDNSPGKNIMHGQWSSPALGVLGGVPQVIFAGGDGWLYSFRADTWDKKASKPILLWKFDANPKESKWILGGRGTRNNIIAAPVIYKERVYIAVGQDPEHGEGKGHLWCIDPTKQGDVSPELAMTKNGDKLEPIPHQKLQAVNPKLGDVAVKNPNSAVIWHYTSADRNGDGEMDFNEEFHRTISSPAIKNDLLFIPDFSGLVHCLDANTGKVHWTSDVLASIWGSPLIVEDRVYIGDEDGDIAIYALSADPKLSLKPNDEYGEPAREIYMQSSVQSTPIVANDVLFISDRSHLYAIQNKP